MRRSLTLFAAAALALAATLTPLPATAAPAGCEGVWVVVDATALGGQVSTACAPAHATGSEALASAGFTVARAGAMICQLDGQPERCEVTASAYWSYWQATPSGDGYGPWQYATLGAGSYHPRGGDAEGWSFGDGSKPPSELPAELATPGSPAPSGEASTTPAASPTPTPPPAGSDSRDASGPIGLAVVAGIAVAAGLGIWLARRRRR